MNKQVYVLMYIDNIDGYSETQAVSSDKSKLEQYCNDNEIKLDEDKPQMYTIQLVTFIS